MNEIAVYLDNIKFKLIVSPIVAEYQIVKERVTATDGYLRVRAALTNSDYLEMAECFERTATGIQTVDYHHQWMDTAKSQLHRRWDNTPHHPELPSFPHHIHVESDGNVVAGQSTSICQILDVLEELLQNTGV